MGANRIEKLEEGFRKIKGKSQEEEIEVEEKGLLIRVKP